MNLDFINPSPLFSFNLFGLEVDVSSSSVMSFAILIVLSIIMYYLGSNLEVIPKKKKQVISESIYGFLYDLISNNIGSKYLFTVPLLGTLFVYIVGMNVVGLFGLKPPTINFSTSFGLAIVAFLMIHAIAIKFGGLGGYLKSYTKPIAPLLPITIMERILFPLSLTLRLFGNILAATVIMTLLYETLLKLYYIGALVIPVPFHMYFDIFDGFLQGFIFTMLTMVQIKLLAEESSEEHE